MDWNDARTKIQETFFKDEIELYKNVIETNDLGEEVERPTLVGEFKCNIENSENSVKAEEGGLSSPQSVRISTVKSIPLDYDYTYKVKIKLARVAHDANKFWNVLGWTEAQISTVITATREVRV